MRPCFFAAWQASRVDGGGGIAEGGGDAGPVEPFCAREDLVPIDVAGLDARDGGMGAVVGDFRGALAGAALEKVDADAVAAADDVPGADAKAAQLIDGALGHVVVREAGDELGIEPVVGQGDGDIGLAAAVGEFEVGGLGEAQVAGGGQAHHDFAKGNDHRGVGG